ncbi:metallophosphoesterase family protein [Tropicibacter oceani]|uniref:Metallophosphoesterase family protein n=1 Tax=Tropicibacter oceani TaxID=3058420 RepID=A0ABY8QKW2_9RHOB|nr:metallophosphoesterase family protein [Tropicibacter oceani]WGW04641.1 metallophosphoesterase family protein [Tropicibacter oceani]
MRLFGSKPAPKPVFDAPLAPDHPFYAVGDIHGCDGLLAKLFDRFAADAHPSARLICVGDYVDRGEESAQVLKRLHAMQTESGGMMVCLMGNHERMLLNFLDDPAGQGVRWMRNGGLQTLASYRLPGAPETASPEVWQDLGARLRDSIGEEIITWLRALPLHWQTGNVAVTHAGADPNLPIARQGEKALIWGRSGFFEDIRKDGVWVAYGHVITREAKADNGRIPLDTGAYATGKLTAALIEPGKLTYMSA